MYIYVMFCSSHCGQDKLKGWLGSASTCGVRLSGGAVLCAAAAALAIRASLRSPTQASDVNVGIKVH